MVQRVLIICGHNSARSQMAEEFLRRLGGEAFTVESAGFEPRPINPYVIAVMKEVNIDISHKEPQDVFELYRAGRHYDHVITACSDDQENNCPIFPRLVNRLHLPFPDPASLEGTPQEVLERTRRIRDDIKQRMAEFSAWVLSDQSRPLPPPWQVR
jgi:arsenate reductase